MRQALQSFDGELPDQLVQRLARELAVELDARDWGEVDDAFVPLVRAPGPDPDLPTSTVLGSARVRALHASLRGGPSRQGGTLTLTDRAQLPALLMESGLPAEGAARVAADAAWGILLVPGSGESRIGGRPVLADAWPLTADGRPLTHLATLALAELPDVEGREVLPDSGYLSFFADLEDEEAP